MPPLLLFLEKKKHGFEINNYIILFSFTLLCSDTLIFILSKLCYASKPHLSIHLKHSSSFANFRVWHYSRWYCRKQTTNIISTYTAIKGSLWFAGVNYSSNTLVVVKEATGFIDTLRHLDVLWDILLGIIWFWAVTKNYTKICSEGCH